MFCREGIFHGKPPKIKVVNTVGCGDSMVGALAVALFRGYEPQKALQFAVAVASANAMSPSTGYFDPDVYIKLVDQVKVSKI